MKDKKSDGKVNAAGTSVLEMLFSESLQRAITHNLITINYNCFITLCTSCCGCMKLLIY